MSLFVDPIAPNNGTVDRTYLYRGSYLARPGQIIGEYLRSDGDVANTERIFVKHDESHSTIRSVVQSTGNFLIDETTRKVLGVNLSLYAHKNHTTAQITAELLSLLSLTNGGADPTAAQIAFVAKFVQRLV